MAYNNQNKLYYYRRGDHLGYQKENNIQELSEDYFLDAMDMYRLV